MENKNNTNNLEMEAGTLTEAVPPLPEEADESSAPNSAPDHHEHVFWESEAGRIDEEDENDQAQMTNRDDPAAEDVPPLPDEKKDQADQDIRKLEEAEQIAVDRLSRTTARGLVSLVAPPLNGEQVTRWILLISSILMIAAEFLPFVYLYLSAFGQMAGRGIPLIAGGYGGLLLIIILGFMAAVILNKKLLMWMLSLAPGILMLVKFGVYAVGFARARIGFVDMDVSFGSGFLLIAGLSLLQIVLTTVLWVSDRKQKKAD